METIVLSGWEPCPDVTFQFTKDLAEVQPRLDAIRQKVTENPETHLLEFPDPDWRRIAMCISLPYSDLRPDSDRVSAPVDFCGGTLFNRYWLDLIIQAVSPDKEKPIWLFTDAFEDQPSLSVVRPESYDLEVVYCSLETESLLCYTGNVVCDESLDWVIVTGSDDFFAFAGKKTLIHRFEELAGGADVVELFMALSLACDRGFLSANCIYKETDWEIPPEVSDAVRSSPEYQTKDRSKLSPVTIEGMHRILRRFNREHDFNLDEWFETDGE
jgi:hypothetical protein